VHHSSVPKLHDEASIKRLNPAVQQSRYKSERANMSALDEDTYRFLAT
jgi:hypothetical protein